MNKKNTKKFIKRLKSNERIIDPITQIYILEDESYFTKSGKKIRKNTFLASIDGNPELNAYRVKVNNGFITTGTTKIKDDIYEMSNVFTITERKIFRPKSNKSHKILKFFVKLIDQEIDPIEKTDY